MKRLRKKKYEILWASEGTWHYRLIDKLSMNTPIPSKAGNETPITSNHDNGGHSYVKQILPPPARQIHNAVTEPGAQPFDSPERTPEE